jgi:hypothetical protein
LCFQTSSGGGWFTASHVKLHLDLAVGETGDIDRENKGKTETLAQRVQDLNARLHDIRREQVFQRVSSPSLPRISVPPGCPVRRVGYCNTGGG